MRKYLPYILFIVAALFLYWIKKNQKEAKSRDSVIVSEPYPPFNREPAHIKYSRHARCRMDCRQIDESEVTEILKSGTLKYDKIEKSEKGYSYPLEGYTHDDQHVRIVFAPDEDTLIVVTAIDLEKEWKCNCN